MLVGPYPKDFKARERCMDAQFQHNHFHVCSVASKFRKNEFQSVTLSLPPIALTMI
jgi:hypothetical protein